MELREDNWDGNYPNISVSHDSIVWFFFALAFGESNRLCLWQDTSIQTPSFETVSNTKLIKANMISRLNLHKEAKKVSQSAETVEASGDVSFLAAKLLWSCCSAFIVSWLHASFSCFSCDWQKWKLKTIQEKTEIKTKLMSTYGSLNTSYFLVSLCSANCFISNSHYTLEDF